MKDSKKEVTGQCIHQEYMDILEANDHELSMLAIIYISNSGMDYWNGTLEWNTGLDC